MNEENKTELYYISTGSGGERRRFLRVGANFVLSYYVVPGEVKKTDMTMTRNISLGGICFTSDKNFPNGTMLHLTLRLPKVDKLVEVIGEVVYIRQEKNKKLLFDIGVKFLKADENDLYILDRVVKNSMSLANKVIIKSSRQINK